MLKKFISGALLSVFMDKKARQKLNQVRSSKAKRNKPKKSAAKAKTPPAPPQPEPDPLEAMNSDEINTLIRDSLDAAEQEIIGKKAKPPVAPGRQALIDEALAIHRSKSHIIDELPKEQREKLVYMATQALGARLKDSD